jgi:thiamine biosynthesis lipoprotein
MKLMGNMFEIAILGESESIANALIDLAVDEIKRIESLLTTFSDDSVTNQININAGITPINVPSEVFDLIFRCDKISKLTQGAFDISYGGLDKSFWNFDLSMTKLPSPQNAANSVRLIDYRNIILDHENKSIFLKEKGMRIGFGGIGKGYAADKAAQLLKNNGVESGFVNASGDLYAWGYQENGSPWTIGVADPSRDNEAFSSLNITNAAVATSGDYEKYVMINGRRYSHTIDPKTGYPVTGIKSVTIVTASAELADALATPIMVMGVKVGLDLINQMKNVACIIIDDNNKLFLSNNISVNQ